MRTWTTGPAWEKAVTFAVTVVLGVFCLVAQGQATLPGRAIDKALFELREMDMHIHTGMERQVSLEEWINLSVADGRKVMVLLDHIELYRSSPIEHAISVKKWGNDWYPLGADGHKALMNDLTSTQARKDVITFRGWEIWEGELDEGVDPNPCAWPRSSVGTCRRTAIHRLVGKPSSHASDKSSRCRRSSPSQ